MKIDVVIPTYRPDERLVYSLKMLADQSLPPRKAVLIDTLMKDGSSPLEALLAKEKIGDSIKGMEIMTLTVPADEFDHGGTRDLGAARCGDADRILFMTQDAVPADQSLVEELEKGFEENEKAAACYARQLPMTCARLEERLSRQINYPDVSRVKTKKDYEELGVRTSFCSNVCAMYDAKVYRERGGFIHHTVFNEDMIYADGAIEAGFSIIYCAGAKVVHSHNYTAGQQFRRNFDLGVSQVSHPEVFGKVSSEGAGVSYVKVVTKELIKSGAATEIPGFYVRCAFRLLGYKTGKNYQKLPKAWVRSFTMSPAYWNKEVE